MAELPREADIVVIGGGIVGCSLVYHLAKAGCKNVVLLEKHQIGSGTTWHSAALVTVLRGSPTLAALARYSAQLYASLEAETGQNTGWRRNGHLTLAASHDRLQSLRHAASAARSFDLDVEIITASDVKAQWPLLHTADLHGALWSPSSGQTNPTDTCQALLKGARALGARIFEGTAVEGFDVIDGRLEGVRTAGGSVRCEKAVISAGLWSRQVAGLAGVAAPLYACEHLYLLTDTIPGVHAKLPAVRDSDAYLYMREDVGGLLVGCFEPNPKPLPLERLPQDSAFVLFEEDWDHFEPMMRNAVHRIPALGAAGVRSFINGPESFTLDGAPLVGESPEVRGLFVAAGMNSSGVVYGGGVGWALSEWMMSGKPPIDLWTVDVRRYSRADNTLASLSIRIPEVLAKHFEIPWPGMDYETLRGVRRTPLHGALEQRGAHFTQRAGWERPAWFAAGGSPVPAEPTYGRPPWFSLWQEEHQAARNEVAIFDQSPFAKLLLQGRDAPEFLEQVCANRMSRPVGSVIYTPLLNESGGIESDLTVTRLPDHAYLLVTGSQQATRDAHWLRSRFPAGAHLCLTDVSSAYAVIGVCGPRSRELLSRVSPADFSSAAFPFQSARRIEIGYALAWALRASYTGELGWELYVPAEFAAGVLETLLEAGAPLQLRLGGVHAMSSLRIERGFRSWGHDIGPAVTPFEAGIGFAVDFDKPEFLGRSALLAQRGRTPARRLLSFVFDTDQAFPHHHEPIYRDGRRCGSVTSASFGHTLGRPVALGFVQGGRLDAEGLAQSRFEIEVADRRHPATALLRAPVDPGGSRMRQ